MVLHERSPRLITTLLFVLLGYSLGSIPIAYLSAKARGTDIFQVGTGNPGAANVFREVGKGVGSLVLLGDALKGALPVAVSVLFSESYWVGWGVGLAALLGHWFPLWLKFRGGAGLATSIGIGVALLPVPTAIVLPPSLALWYLWRNTAYVASIGYLGFIILAVVLREPPLLIFMIAVLPSLALVRQELMAKPSTTSEQQK